MSDHYIALMPAYISAAGLWYLFYRFLKSPWRNGSEISFKKPWLEFIYALLAVIVILGIGQLYVREMLLPNDGNDFIDALNQLIIFSPTLLLVALRKQSLETIWLPKSKVPYRITLGLIIALVSLFVYWLIRKDAANLLSIISNTYHPKNISHFVQVFLEDITIALLFVRLAACFGQKWTILTVAVLFAAGHIPSMLSKGATIIELGSLLIDVSIGVIVLGAVSKSKDVWWFFMVHFALDMTQYYGGIN